MTKTVVYFTPDFTDTSTISRGEAFLRHGCRFVVAGFRRDRYVPGFRPPWTCISLGQTRDGRYLQRIVALLVALPILIMRRDLLREADVFYARNIEQLLLAITMRIVTRKQVQIVYEILDIQPIFVGLGRASRLLRALERFGLRHIELLVLSSPAFLRNYFKPLQGYTGEWFLLENKLPASIQRDVGRSAFADGGYRGGAGQDRPSRYRWVVGYSGLIRGRETFDLIAALAERLKDVVLFKFHGVLTTVDSAHFEANVARLDNLVYEGPYVNPQDLPAIYGSVDFAWALDLENKQHNSRWLLPCRFYEAGYFGVPCLAADGFEVGRLIEALGVGWSIEQPYLESLTEFFLTLSPEEYAARRNRLLSLPVNRFVAENDIPALLDTLGAGDHVTAASKAVRSQAGSPRGAERATAEPSGEQ